MDDKRKEETAGRCDHWSIGGRRVHDRAGFCPGRRVHWFAARGRAGLEGAKNDVERLGGEAIAPPTDVADADAVEAAAVEAKLARSMFG